MSIESKIDMFLGDTLDEKKELPYDFFKLVKAETKVIQNQVKSVMDDLRAQDIQGLRASIGTLKFSADRI